MRTMPLVSGSLTKNFTQSRWLVPLKGSPPIPITVVCPRPTCKGHYPSSAIRDFRMLIHRCAQNYLSSVVEVCKVMLVNMLCACAFAGECRQRGEGFLDRLIGKRGCECQRREKEDDSYLRGLVNSLVGECARARHNSNATRLRALFGFIRIRGCKDPSRIPIPMNEIRRCQ